MRRIVVVGCPGSGKSTIARELSNELGLTHIELDALFHQPNWTVASNDQFQASIAAAMDEADKVADGWVMCGNYNRQSGGIHHERADTFVWLDLPKSVIMSRVTLRTLRRGVTREELWNGNREPLSNFYRWDPEKNIIRWAWVNFDKYRSQYAAKLEGQDWAYGSVHRLRSKSEVFGFLAGLATDD